MDLTSRYSLLKVRPLIPGKAPLENWKVSGNIPKTYEKEAKGYVFSLENSSVCKMQVPKDEKQLLGLT
jgi:hypothetical protein